MVIASASERRSVATVGDTPSFVSKYWIVSAVIASALDWKPYGVSITVTDGRLPPTPPVVLTSLLITERWRLVIRGAISPEPMRTSRRATLSCRGTRAQTRWDGAGRHGTLSTRAMLVRRTVGYVSHGETMELPV